MKKIGVYEISTCTAVAVGVDPERQPALFVHRSDDEFRDGDAVVFGYDASWINDEYDLASIFEDWRAWSSDEETLATVEFDSGEGID